MVAIHTSRGVEIEPHIARDLRILWLAATGDHIAARVWRELLTNEQRMALGGQFGAAVRSAGTGVQLYRAAKPGMTLERAVLEINRQLGMMLDGKYRRLFMAIGEDGESSAPLVTKPNWDGRVLWYRGLQVRRIQQPGRATRLRAVLEAFQELGWPDHVSLDDVGLTAAVARQTIYDFNDMSRGIRFEMDGNASGITWRPSDACDTPIAGQAVDGDNSANPSTMLGTQIGESAPVAAGELLKLSAQEIHCAFVDSDWANIYPPILTVDQAASLLSVPKATVYDWSSRGLLAGCARRVGKRLLFFRDRLIQKVFNEGL
jgi:excisionase family DNA binding protein